VKFEAMLKIWQHFITQIKSTREVPRPLIYRRKDELLSFPYKLSRYGMGELGLETLAYKTSF